MGQSRGERLEDFNSSLNSAPARTVNTLVMWLLVSAGLHYLLAQIAATVIVLFWNYVVALRWVFTDAGSR